MSEQNDADTAAPQREVPPDPEPNPSLKDECCPGPDGKAYNEAKARQEFGDAFVDGLMKKQPQFRGDWSHLAWLVKCERLERERPVDNNEPLPGWNQWALLLQDERIHLEHANLRYMHLAGAKLQGARLEHAELWEAHLEHCCLDKAHLESAELWKAHLDKAFLSEAHLDKAWCEGTNFHSANLFIARLQHIEASGACFTGAVLDGADFQHADLARADLSHACLEGANLARARVDEANLGGADLRRVKGLRFDENYVRDIRIEGNAPDPWSVLRRKYTGPWFFLHLLLLVLFFAPYAGRLVALTATARAEEWLAARGPAIRQGIEERAAAEQRDEWLALWDRAWNAAVEQADKRGERVGAWWVLIGGTKAWWVVPLAAIVVVYNALRLALTLRVGLLRDAEERSSVTPRLEEYMGARAKPDLDAAAKLALGWLERFGLYRLHQIARILLWIAVASVVVNSVVWLATTWVWVPK